MQNKEVSVSAEERFQGLAKSSFLTAAERRELIVGICVLWYAWESDISNAHTFSLMATLDANYDCRCVRLQKRVLNLSARESRLRCSPSPARDWVMDRESDGKTRCCTTFCSKILSSWYSGILPHFKSILVPVAKCDWPVSCWTFSDCPVGLPITSYHAPSNNL